MASIKLKAAVNGTGRTSRPIEFKVQVVINRLSLGMSAKQALMTAVKQFDQDAPDSYEKHPHTYLDQFTKTVAKVIDDPSNKNFEVVKQMLMDADLLEETDEEDEVEAEETQQEEVDQS